MQQQKKKSREEEVEKAAEEEGKERTSSGEGKGRPQLAKKIRQRIKRTQMVVLREATTSRVKRDRNGRVRQQ
jgi:hypothetical protein